MALASSSPQAEIEIASTWFAEQLFDPNEQREIFCTKLRVRRAAPFILFYSRRTHPLLLHFPGGLTRSPALLLFLHAQDLLTARYEGHWYPEEPHRGCAYRAILSTVNQIDPLLMRAAESTGQRGLYDSFNRVFAEVGEVNCWVRRRRRRAALSVCLSTSGAVPHPPFHLSLSLCSHARRPPSSLGRSTRAR